MSTRTAALLFGLAACAAAPAASQPGDGTIARAVLPGPPSSDGSVLSVRALGNAVVETQPGVTVGLAFRVSNPSDRPVRPDPSYRLPPGWSVVSGPDPSPVPPGAERVVLVGVRPPRHAPSGLATVGLGMGAADAGVTVRVGRRTGLEVVARRPPSVVVAGTATPVVWEVRNTGNDTLAVDFEATAGRFSLRDGAGQVRLAPGETAVVTPVLQVPGALAVSSSVPLVLRGVGRYPGDPDGAVTAYGRSETRAVPSPQVQRQRGPRARVIFEALALSSDAAGVQGAVSAAVPLRYDSTVTAYARLRSPSPVLTRLSQPGEAVVGVRAPAADARVGSAGYELSRLAGGYRFGPGAEARASAGRWSGHVLYRRVRDRDAALGASVTRAVRSGTVSLYGLRQRGGSVATVGLRSRAVGTLDVEAGVSGRDSLRPVVRGTWGLSRGRLAASVGVDDQHADHPSGGAGSRWRTANASYRLTDAMAARVHAEHFQIGRGPRRRTLRNVEGTLSHRSAHGAHTLRTWVGLGARDAATVTGTESVRQAQLVGTVGASVRRGPVTVHGTTEAGGAERGDGERSPSVLTSLTATWSGRRTRAVLSGNVGLGRSIYGRRDGATWGGRALVTHRAGPVQAEARVLWVHRGSAVGPLVGGYAEGHLSVAAPVTRAATLAVDLIAARSGGPVRPQLGVRLQVAMAGRGPVPFRSDGVTGRVVDAASGRGIGGVLLSLGPDVAVTGDDGAFEFLRPTPGVYALQVDRLSMGAGLVPAVPLPMGVEVPAEGRVRAVEIPVWVRSRVRGQVRVYEVYGGGGGATSEPVAVRAAGGVVVVARRGDVGRQTRTDADGRFKFDDLPPGAWTVAVTAGAPEGTRSEPRTVDVDPGSESTLDLRLLPVPRRVRVRSVGAEGARPVARTLRLDRQALPVDAPAHLGEPLPGADEPRVGRLRRGVDQDQSAGPGRGGDRGGLLGRTVDAGQRPGPLVDQQVGPARQLDDGVAAGRVARVGEDAAAALEPQADGVDGVVHRGRRDGDLAQAQDRRAGVERDVVELALGDALPLPGVEHGVERARLGERLGGAVDRDRGLSAQQPELLDQQRVPADVVGVLVGEHDRVDRQRVEPAGQHPLDGVAAAVDQHEPPRVLDGQHRRGPVGARIGGPGSEQVDRHQGREGGLGGYGLA